MVFCQLGEGEWDLSLRELVWPLVEVGGPREVPGRTSSPPRLTGTISRENQQNFWNFPDKFASTFGEARNILQVILTTENNY